MWVTRDGEIARGDVVFFYWPSLGRIGHVGIVDEITGDDTFYSWEGNTDVSGGRSGGRVMRQHRSRSTVGKGGGFGIPAYDVVDLSRALPTTVPLRALKLRTPIMRGEDVREIQSMLHKLGEKLAVDGLFGKDTEVAVRNFQKRSGLEADGIVGAITRGALHSAVA